MKEIRILEMNEMPPCIPIKQTLHKRTKADCRKLEKQILLPGPARPSDLKKNAEFLAAVRKEKEELEAKKKGTVKKSHSSDRPSFLWKN